jgi:xylulokinase
LDPAEVTQEKFMEKYVLGVDIGSGSVKLTLLSKAGKIAATAGCEYPTHYPHVGWCEQEPEDWCKAFGAAFADILRSAPAKAEQIEALALDAATHTAVLLDEDLRIIRPAILWTDQRSKEEVQWLKENCLELVMKQAMNAPTTVWTLPQFMWLRKHEPENWSRIHKILFAKDYLRYRITGTMETDTIEAAGSMFYDVINECWSDELCAVGDIQKEWLPKLCKPTDVVGNVTREAAEEFGLSTETKVLVGTTDTVMEVFAAGNVEPGHMTVKLATAGRICVITDRQLDSKFIFNYRHVVPGLWYPGTATASCAASYRWYRDIIGREPFAELNVPAEEIPAGSDGISRLSILPPRRIKVMGAPAFLSVSTPV